MTEDRSLDRHTLRVRLREHRKRAQLTQQQAASKLEWSASKVHRIEAGTIPVAETDLRMLLQVYGVDDADEAEHLQRVAQSARDSFSGPFRRVLVPSVRRYVNYEENAEQILNYEPMFVPGLLQTPAYTRALLSEIGMHAPDSVALEAAVRVRTHRQRILDLQRPVRLDVLLDEAVILRPVGGPAVMRKQLEHLWAMSVRPNVSLGIVPLTAGAYPGLRTPFVIMRFGEPAPGDLLFLEDPLNEVITLGSAEAASPQPDRYLAAFDSIRALAGPDSLTTQRLKEALLRLGPEL